MTRRELEARQQDVLQSLLHGDLPEGFDPRSAALTTRMLRTKRRSEALEAVPGLREVPDLAGRFDGWAADHPRRGCPHDDVIDFLASTDGPLPVALASVRAVERVCRGDAVIARDRRPRERPFIVAIGGRVWHLGRRAPR